MTTEILALPEPKSVSHVVGELLDRNVGIQKVDPEEIGPSVTGIFANASGDSGVVVSSDIELSNFAGAALSLMPVDASEDGIRSQSVPEVILENFREVVNVLGVLLNRRGGPHVELWYVLDETTDLPEGLPEALDAADQRIDFLLDIDGYGKGRMTFRIWP